MSLGIAIRNNNSIVVAADHADDQTPSADSRFITLHNRTVVVISGNRLAVESALLGEALKRVDQNTTTAAVAQYIHASLMLHVVPQIDKLRGRVEIMVAGIDPIRHTTEPDTYYMDSANGFYLTISPNAITLTGATAVAAQLLANVDVSNQPIETLVALAKEAFTATRLRWPSVIGPKLKLAVVSPGFIQVYDY